jgi:predicted metal-binding protein
VGFDGGRIRADELLLVCARCRPEATDGWMRELRRRVYALIGRDCMTVTTTGCLRNCPRDGVSVVLASPTRGCWEWTIIPEPESSTQLLTSLVAHGSVEVPETSTIALPQFTGDGSETRGRG